MLQRPLLKTLSCLSLICAFPAVAGQPNKDATIAELKQHFAFAGQLHRLSVSYKGERQTTYQSNDYRSPYTIQSQYEYQYDTVAKQFYFHDQHVYPGNFIFDKKVIHQKGNTTLYDVNGFNMGKQLEALDYSLAEFKADLADDIDFLAAHRFLFSDSKVEAMFDPNHQWIDVTRSDNPGGKVTARFMLDPIQLSSLTYHESNKKTEFSQPAQQGKLNYARTIRHFRNGKLRQAISISELQSIAHIDQALLQVPAGYGPLVDSQRQPLQWQMLAKDLYLINYVAGDRHVMVKTDDEGVTVFGAPVSADVSQQVVELIHKNLPGQPIHSVYITHPHSDHMRGLVHFGNLGVKIVADAYSIEAIKAYPPFADTVSQWQFQTISHKQTLNGATYYIPENSHSLGQSFVMFDQSKILYQGDFLEIPADNSLPTHMADVEKEFIDYLRQEKLPFTRIVGHHRNNNITPEIVDAYYAAHHPERQMMSQR